MQYDGTGHSVKSDLLIHIRHLQDLLEQTGDIIRLKGHVENLAGFSATFLLFTSVIIESEMINSIIHLHIT